MKPAYQTRDGIGGNCLQVALASLLELPLEAVPDFMSGPDGLRMWPFTLGAWLQGRSLERAALSFGRHSILQAIYFLPTDDFAR
jgi:hypothetical protein